MTFLESVCNAFARAGIRYAVVGGHAVALHGAPRGTIDIDFVVRWDKESLQQVERTLQLLGLESRLPITATDVFSFRDEYIERRNLIAWNFYNPSDLTQQVDILINYDLGAKRTKVLGLSHAEVRVLNLTDLINMKKSAGREQDMADVAALERIQRMGKSTK